MIEELTCWWKNVLKKNFIAFFLEWGGGGYRLLENGITNLISFRKVISDIKFNDNI